VARVRAGEAWSGEFAVRRRDGGTVPLQVTDAPLYDADGRIAGMVGVAVNVSARQAAKEARRVGERDYRALLEQAADAILIFGDDGRLQTVNARACGHCQAN
jgi:PAS domain-containing protein